MTHDPGSKEHQVVLRLIELTQADKLTWEEELAAPDHREPLLMKAEAGTIWFHLSWRNGTTTLIIKPRFKGTDYRIQGGGEGSFQTVVTQALDTLVSEVVTHHHGAKERALAEVLDDLTRLNEPKPKKPPWWLPWGWMRVLGVRI